MIDHRRERRRLSRSGRAGHQNQPATLVGDAVDYRRQAKLHAVLALIGNYAQHDADAAALLKNVRAKSAQPFDAVGDVDFRVVFQFLLLPIRHHRKRHVERVLGRESRRFRNRVQLAADPHHRKRADFQM